MMKQFSVFLLSVLLIIGCGQHSEGPAETTAEQTPPPPSAPPAVESSNPAPVTATTGAAAGIQWTVPELWTAQPERPMRIATYSVPAAPGDSEGGECAVFFFGTGQGGDVRSNIDRWIGQFKTESKPVEAKKTVNNLPVTTVSISGTYLASGGPMMQSQGEKPNYKLLGAIVEAPEGAVFFKMTGPNATIAAAENDFNALIDSVRLP